MRTPRTTALFAALLAALIGPMPGAAQEPPEATPDLPPEVAEGVIAFLNDPGTVLFDAPARIPEGTAVEGEVGVLGGPLWLDGSIHGGVVVVNGDLELGAGARVEGNVIVVGGAVRGDTEEAVAGTVTIYQEPLAFAQQEDRIVLRARPGDPEERGATFLFGRSSFLIRTSGTYNRVEGLPVLFGPVVEGGEADPWRVEVLALWRSESGLALDGEEMGYLFRGEKRIGGSPTLVLGGSYHSLVDGLPTAGPSELESSLSTFFLHKDLRDYVERSGWSASLGLMLDRAPLDLRVTYADEDHLFAPVSSPWTLRRNDDPWRPQPLVAEGDVRTLTGELEVDTRNDRDDPSHGWHLSASLTRGVSGDLAVPEVVRPTGADPVVVPARRVDAGFTLAAADLRRYNRVSPASELDMRLFWRGSIDGDPLPSQYQAALGGEGTLPGYGLFDLDCGARADLLRIDRVAYDDDQDTTQPVFPSYGCDRALLVQLEYRHHFPWNLDLGGDDDPWTGGPDWSGMIDLDPTVVAFLDLGRGWSEGDPALDTETVSDVGLGFYLGDLGIYWAWPLTGDNRSLNFFVRLDRRF